MSRTDRHEFVAELWEYEGPTAWFFVSLPEDVADAIDAAQQSKPRAGFGSVRVEVTVGGTTWSTSVFPDKKRGTYLLPVKKDVRRAEKLETGAEVALTIRTST